jgi:hypothetical protein
LGDVSALKMNGEVMALLKWTDAGRSIINLNVRTDSQDAWVFQSPLNNSVIEQSDFIMGVPRCDNRIAYVLESCGHHVYSPAFAIHAVEIHSHDRDPSGLYSFKNAPFGEIKTVLLSDRVTF